MAEKVNYSEEMEQQLLALYKELGNEGLEDIAEQMDKPVRSIRSKLVQKGWYVPSPKGSTKKATGPSKKELLRDIEAVGFDTTGLDPASKSALSRLLEHLTSDKH